MRPTLYPEVLKDTRAFLKEDSTRVPTGYAEVDHLLKGGIRLGRVCFLIGRSEVGETTVAVNLAVNAALAGHHVAFASLEMTKEEVALRAISAVNDEDPDDVERWLASDDFDDLEKMKKAVADIGLLSIDDSTKPDWAELKKWVDDLEVATGRRPTLVVLDHLKLMKRYGYPRGEVERVQQLAEDAKAFAKEANVALLLIHQVGRSQEGAKHGEKNHGDIPLTMEDMMYGGEQDADVILGVFRPERNPLLSESERRRERGRTFLQVLKNRHGESCLPGFPLMWHRPSMRMEAA